MSDTFDEFGDFVLVMSSDSGERSVAAVETWRIVL